MRQKKSMPSRSDFPGEINRAKLVRALSRLGFIISTKGGDGSHYKITWPKNGKSFTIPQRVGKDVLGYLCKQIEEKTGVTWKDINKNL
jgi:predicted RNA binding protein YcfA (HicA-like mRNA interferase family)